MKKYNLENFQQISLFAERDIFAKIGLVVSLNGESTS